jgi:hypothetical protein
MKGLSQVDGMPVMRHDGFPMAQIDWMYGFPMPRYTDWCAAVRARDGGCRASSAESG